MDTATFPAGLLTSSSPVLVGRDDLLALAERRLAAVRMGAGHVLLLTGEAGIGKSRLLGAIERRAASQRPPGRAGFTVVRASAFPRDLELTGALFDDLARTLSVGAPDLTVAAAAITERLRPAARPRGDAHRLRRLLVRDLSETLAGLATSGPIMLSLEDLHWADDLTLEVVFHVAREIRSVPMLIAATYRSDELLPRVPMRDWRARLLAQRLAEEVRLQPLDLRETAMMASAMLGGELPASRDLVGELHARSEGNPLYVEELMGAMRAAAGPVGRDVRTMPLPDTLAVAILQRMQPLSRAARRIVTAAAVIGRSFDLDLLSRSIGVTMERLAAPLGELQSQFVIVPTSDGGGYDFRHALIRDAIYRDTPLPTRRLLHGRVADASRTASAPPSDADLSAHYEQAGRRPEAYSHALSAAERSRALSAHRESLDLYRRALTNLDRRATAADRAAVLACIGDEAAATDQNESAIEAYEEARRLLLAAGGTHAAAAIVPRLAAVRHLLGDDLEARVALIRSGLMELEGDDQGLDRERAALRASLAAAYMLDRRLDESIEHGEAARRLATSSADLVTEINAASTLASVLVFAGRMDEGWELHAATVERARLERLEAEAARAYRMVATCASVLVEYDLAERWLREGIEYAERVELWNHRHYMAAHLAHVAWATGEWASAEEIAAHVLADGRGGITTRITALHGVGYVALGRGEWERATTALDEARELGERMGELQRFAPAWWGLAEVALLSGATDRAVALTERGSHASREVRDAAYLFPFMITGTRARLAAGDPLGAERWVERLTVELRHRSIPGTLPAVDHARGLLAFAAGRTGEARSALQAAVAGWGERRRCWEGTWAIIDLARCAVRAHRPAEAARLALSVQATAAGLGAEPLTDAARSVLAGVRGRNVEEEPWAPLTAREFQVARLVADGLTNPAIGAELGIATKTVSAHMEHILLKLGASRRAEIGAWVTTVRPREGVRD